MVTEDGQQGVAVFTVAIPETLPGGSLQEDNLLSLGPQWLKYSENRNEYLNARHQAYGEKDPNNG